MKKLLGALLMGCFALACSSQASSGGSQSTPVEFSDATRLRLSGASGRVALELDATESAAPRMAEVRVKWTGGWHIAKSEAGAAALAASKKVIVQPMGDSEARILVFASDNTNSLHSGPLAHLSLEGGSGGTIDIVPTPPFLAPTESEKGLQLGEPLSL